MQRDAAVESSRKIDPDDALPYLGRELLFAGSGADTDGRGMDQKIDRRHRFRRRGTAVGHAEVDRVPGRSGVVESPKIPAVDLPAVAVQNPDQCLPETSRGPGHHGAALFAILPHH